MAFWITHLRIAEQIQNMGLQTEELPFYVGSLAPDSGIELAPFQYDPPKAVTHWHKNLPVRLDSNLCFYDRYLKDEKDPAKRAFYLGYFAHILTDTMFFEEVVNPILVSKNTDSISVKGDWLNADFLFMASHPDFYPYRAICGIEKCENVYLDYLPGNSLEAQIHRVRDTFAFPTPDLDRPMQYLNMSRMDQFVKDCSEKIMQIFEEKDLL